MLADLVLSTGPAGHSPLTPPLVAFLTPPSNPQDAEDKQQPATLVEISLRQQVLQVRMFEYLTSDSS